MLKRFKDTFPSEWVKYVVVVILSVALWIWFFGIYHAPQEYEMLEVFYVGEIRDYSFEKIAKEDLAIEGLRKVELNSAKPGESAFDTKVLMVGLGSSDIVIVPESLIDTIPYKGHVVELEQGDFVKDGVIYGVYLPEKAKKSLSKYFAFGTDRYVVFAASTSVNAGKITDNSFKLIDWLVEQDV